MKRRDTYTEIAERLTDAVMEDVNLSEDDRFYVFAALAGHMVGSFSAIVAHRAKAAGKVRKSDKENYTETLNYIHKILVKPS